MAAIERWPVHTGQGVAAIERWHVHTGQSVAAIGRWPDHTRHGVADRYTEDCTCKCKIEMQQIKTSIVILPQI